MRGDVVCAESVYQLLAHQLLADVPGWDNHATVILDIPTGYALEQLETMTTAQRRTTVVLTPATHPAYLDVLTSYYVRQVAPMHNDTALTIMRALIKDDAYTPTYQSRTGLTFTQARVVSLILRGIDGPAAAERLGVSLKTVNAHVANTFRLLGMHSRVELVTKLLTGARADPASEAVPA